MEAFNLTLTFQAIVWAGPQIFDDTMDTECGAKSSCQTYVCDGHFSLEIHLIR